MKTFWISIVIIVLMGCTTQRSVTRGRGYDVEVYLTDGSLIGGELLAITDSSLMIESNGLHYKEHQYIRKVQVPNLKARGKEVIMGVSGALSGGYGLLSLSEIEYNGILPSLILMGCSIGSIYEMNHPKENYKFPLTEKHHQKLLKYCRYPQGLTLDQLQGLEEYYISR